MRPTGATLLRSLYDSIHPPLINKAQTKQLLQVMSRSFQQHIDNRASLSERALKTHFGTIIAHPTFVLPTSAKTHPQVLFNDFQRRLTIGNLSYEYLSRYAQALVKASRNQDIKGLASMTIELLETSGQMEWRDIKRSEYRTSHARVQFIRTIMELLVIDGEDETARRLISTRQESQHILSSAYIRACISERGLEAAMVASLKLPLTSLIRQSCYPLKGIARHMLYHSPDVRVISADVYNSFRHRASELQTDVADLKSNSSFTLAVLDLMHPNEKLRSAKYAMMALEQLDQVETFSSQNAPLNNNPLKLALAAAELLIQQNEYDNADWVLVWSRKYYSAVLNLEKPESQLLEANSEKTLQAPPRRQNPSHRGQHPVSKKHQDAVISGKLDGLLSI